MLSHGQIEFFSDFFGFDSTTCTSALEAFIELSDFMGWNKGSNNQKKTLRELIAISKAEKDPNDLIDLVDNDLELLEEWARDIGVETPKFELEEEKGAATAQQTATSLPTAVVAKPPPPAAVTAAAPTKHNVQAEWRQRLLQIKRAAVSDQKLRHAEFMGEEFQLAVGNHGTVLQEMQQICEDLVGLPVPEALSGCKNALKNVHINVIDYIDYKRYGGERPPTFATANDLAKYSVKEKKVFPREAKRVCKALRILLKEGEE